MQNENLLAAIDLGSNSFRLEIGHFDHGQLIRTEYLKETVRLGNGLDTQRNLSDEAMTRGWECLARFAERIAKFKKKQVRAVATQTLREARNRDVFLAKGHAILGFPIEVISGREEARLIYLGVSHLLPQSNERRLVIDIGGRSTELILGQGYESQAMESYRVGSVTWSMKYFGGGKISKEALRQAEVAAKAVLDEGLSVYSNKHWDQAYGSSGTVGAIADILVELGYPSDRVTRAGLNELKERLLQAEQVDRLKLVGLKDDRRPVLCGGFCVISALFDLLKMDTLYAAQGALRQGVIYDMVEREHDVTDVRWNTVKRMARTFNVDNAQADRVAQVALHLFEQLRDRVSNHDFERLARQLEWVTRLHEIGSQISHSDYHKHGAYILDNVEAMGFAQDELHRLSQWVLGQKGKLRKLEESLQDASFVYPLLCLRLAVIACHARHHADWRLIRLTVTSDGFALKIPQSWLRTHPQSVHLLQQESITWQKTSWAIHLNFDLES